MSAVLPALQHNARQDWHEQVHNQNKPRGGNEMNELTMTNNKKMSFRLPKFSLKELNKNQKGLTLIELLAVIVIIAIIAAIAIPSIGGILKNTRVSAHKSNAHMFIDATRTMITGEGLVPSATKDSWSLTELHDNGFLETIPKDPSNKTQTYDPANTIVQVTPDPTTGNMEYTVTIKGLNSVTHITAKKEAVIDDLKFAKDDTGVQE